MLLETKNMRYDRKILIRHGNLSDIVRLIPASWIILAIASCSVGPDYVRPSVAVPDEFKEINGWKVAQPRDKTINGRWWEIFKDPQLSALEEQVAISNQNIIAAEANFREARALAEAARAGYFPNIGAGASVTRSRNFSSKGSGVTIGTATDYLLSADASWEMDIWGRIRRSVEASRANAMASKADIDAARLSAQAELALDYFQMRSLDAQRQLLDKTVVSYQEFLDLTKNRYAAGVASQADVLQAEAQLKTTKAQAIDIGVQRAQLEHAIALLIGRPPALFSLAPMPLEANLPAIPVSLPSTILERRPDIAAAERRAAAANAQIGVAKAAYFPAISLGASGGLAGSALSSWLLWPNRFWSAGASLTQILFDGGLRGAQNEEARAAYEATVAAYRQTVLGAFREVEDNLAALRILENEALAQDEAVKAAQQSLLIATNQYASGTASYLNVIIAQAAALNAERSAADILGRRMSASVLLIKALGGDWFAPAL
jgi:NodT family efflux transporter outer membrane factor (OMF) lipoprotein